MPRLTQFVILEAVTPCQQKLFYGQFYTADMTLGRYIKYSGVHTDEIMKIQL